MATAVTYFCTFLAILSALFQGAALLSPSWKRYEAIGSPWKNRPAVWVINLIPELTGAKITFLASEFVALILLLLAAIGHIVSLAFQSSFGHWRGFAVILNTAATFLIMLGILDLLALYGNIMEMFYYGLMAIIVSAALSLFAVICSRVDNDKTHVP